jgi:hypothetical protein
MEAVGAPADGWISAGRPGPLSLSPVSYAVRVNCAARTVARLRSPFPADIG